MGLGFKFMDDPVECVVVDGPLAGRTVKVRGLGRVRVPTFSTSEGGAFHEYAVRRVDGDVYLVYSHSD